MNYFDVEAHIVVKRISALQDAFKTRVNLLTSANSAMLTPLLDWPNLSVPQIDGAFPLWMVSSLDFLPHHDSRLRCNGVRTYILYPWQAHKIVAQISHCVMTTKGLPNTPPNTPPGYLDTGTRAWDWAYSDKERGPFRLLTTDIAETTSKTYAEYDALTTLKAHLLPSC